MEKEHFDYIREIFREAKNGKNRRHPVGRVSEVRAAQYPVHSDDK